MGHVDNYNQWYIETLKILDKCRDPTENRPTVQWNK